MKYKVGNKVRIKYDDTFTREAKAAIDKLLDGVATIRHVSLFYCHGGTE